MMIFRSYIRILLALAMLVSCSGKNTEPAKSKQETPEALQDNKVSLKSYRSSGDLTEELYQELADKTPALKKLEEDFQSLNERPAGLQEKFTAYHSKSSGYYGSANYKGSAISDSTLKRKVLALITASSKRYESQTSELNAMIRQLTKNSISLQDHHNILKIVLTMALIEKYQVDNKPDKNEFRNLINSQEDMIERMDSLTPGFYVQ